MDFLGPEFQLDVLEGAGTADDGGHADRNAADAVSSVDLARNGQDEATVEGNAVDDLADGDADGITGSPFAGDDFRAALLGALEDLGLEGGSNAGEFGEREAVHRSRGPHGQHGVAVFAEDHRADLRGWKVERRGDERAETRGVEHGAESEDLGGGKAGFLHCELGEDVHGVRDHKNDRVFFHPGGLEAFEDAEEEGHIPVDEIEAGLVGFAAESGGDANDVGVFTIRVGAGGNFLVRAVGGAVQKVEGLAFGGGLIGVEKDEFADDSGALESEGRAGSDPPAAADDGYFHGIIIC